MLRGIEHLHWDVFEQFLTRRKIATFQITGIVDQHIWIAGLAAYPGERRGNRLLRGEIQLDDHALADLLADSRSQRCGIGFRARGQHDEEALLRKLLRYRAADTPAHRAVVQRLAMRQPVLRPSDCHFDVAPTTTATCLPFVLPLMPINSFF